MWNCFCLEDVTEVPISLQVKPSVNQLSLDSCCIIPQDLAQYARANGIQLTSHHDAVGQWSSSWGWGWGEVVALQLIKCNTWYFKETVTSVTGILTWDLIYQNFSSMWMIAMEGAFCYSLWFQFGDATCQGDRLSFMNHQAGSKNLIDQSLASELLTLCVFDEALSLSIFLQLLLL